MSFSSYLDKIVGREVSFQAAVIPRVTDFDSPHTSLNEILYRAFHECNQPSDAWNFSKFSSFANSRAFSRIIFPWIWIGIFSDLCNSSHLKQAKLTCTYVPSFIRCLLVPPLLLNEVTILSLFFFHVDSVFFGTLNVLDTSLIATPRSISVNAAYLSSKVCSQLRRFFPVILAFLYNNNHTLRLHQQFSIVTL